MRTQAPQLLPLFRSEGQGLLLARIYLQPDRVAPLAELARELGIDAGGVTREADRLEDAGLIRSERIGRQRLLHANHESPFFDELYGLLLKAFGPVAELAPVLGGVAGVQRAVIFGSWADRYAGNPGPAPADIDVMVIGTPERSEIARAARALTERLGREVNITIVSAARWDEAADGVIRQAQSGELIELELGHGE
jgi:predicted nucleotidyltransferase